MPALFFNESIWYRIVSPRSAVCVVVKRPVLTAFRSSAWTLVSAPLGFGELVTLCRMQTALGQTEQWQRSPVTLPLAQL